jgi:hypothetical protein
VAPWCGDVSRGTRCRGSGTRRQMYPLHTAHAAASEPHLRCLPKSPVDSTPCRNANAEAGHSSSAGASAIVHLLDDRTWLLQSLASMAALPAFWKRPRDTVSCRADRRTTTRSSSARRRWCNAGGSQSLEDPGMWLGARPARPKRVRLGSRESGRRGSCRSGSGGSCRSSG